MTEMLQLNRPERSLVPIPSAGVIFQGRADGEQPLLRAAEERVERPPLPIRVVRAGASLRSARERHRVAPEDIAATADISPNMVKSI